MLSLLIQSRKKFVNQGWVADYCPFCQLPQAHKVIRVEDYTFFFGIERADLLGYFARCDACNQRHDVDIHRFVHCVEQKPVDLSQLVDNTNPDLWDEVGARLVIDDRIASGTSCEEERLYLIMEPFVALDDRVVTRRAHVHITPHYILPMLFQGAAPITGWFWAYPMAGPQRPEYFYAGVAVAVVATGALLYFALTDVARFTRKRIVPELARAMQHIAPSKSELEQATVLLAENGYIIQRYVDPDDLLKAIEKQR